MLVEWTSLRSYCARIGRAKSHNCLTHGTACHFMCACAFWHGQRWGLQTQTMPSKSLPSYKLIEIGLGQLTHLTARVFKTGAFIAFASMAFFIAYIANVARAATFFMSFFIAAVLGEYWKKGNPLSQMSKLWQNRTITQHMSINLHECDNLCNHIKSTCPITFIHKNTWSLKMQNDWNDTWTPNKYHSHV